MTTPQNLRNPLVQGQKPRNGCVVLGQENLRRLNQVLRDMEAQYFPFNIEGPANS